MENYGSWRRSESRDNYTESWLSDIINPDKIARIKEYPAYEGHTTEWIIMEALLARLVEAGPEMSSYARGRLRNLVAGLRILIFENQNPQEKEFMIELSKATTVDFASLEVQVNEDLVEDVGWIWTTFGLKKPKSASSLLNTGN